jgi:hypothetical protein
MYGFILWICFPLIGLLPAFFVEEDLRRLNMKEVEKSQYVEEKTLLLKDDAERKKFYRENKIIAADDVLEKYFDIHFRYSERLTYKSESLTTEEYDLKQRTRRLSDTSIKRSSGYEPLIKAAPSATKRDSHIARLKNSTRIGGGSIVDDESIKAKKAIALKVKRKNDHSEDDDDFDDL